MAQAETNLARRALLAAAAIIPAIVTAGTVQGEPLPTLRRQRAAVMAEINAVPTDDDDHYDEEVARLCDLHDALGARMIDHPIRSAADARAKLSVLDDLYHHPMHNDGHDRVLFEQVLAWLDAASGVA